MGKIGDKAKKNWENQEAWMKRVSTATFYRNKTKLWLDVCRRTGLA
jgi:hypothetical protein